MSAQEMTDLTQRLKLAPRQAEIVTHLLFGKADKQITSGMNITVPTVRTYMSRLFRKFGVNDRVELILCILTEARNNNSIEETQRPQSPSAENTYFP